MRWGQIKDEKGSRAVCFFEETVYELPAKLSPLLNFYSRFRLNFGDPKNALSILKENGATVMGHSEQLWESLPFVRPLDKPGKVVCAGLNYRDHAEEMNLPVPEYPALFAKFSNALIGPNDQIRMPADDGTGSTKVDWEVELGLVVGVRLRNATEEQALEGLMGYTVINDVSVRDWQGRSSEWFQGKNWDAMTPFGPVIVSADEVDPLAGLELTCAVDGELRQCGSTEDMLFSPAYLLSYISRFMTLEPGDIVATGTPAGVGLSLHPRRWLKPGQEVRTRIEGIGELVNVCSEAGAL